MERQSQLVVRLLDDLLDVSRIAGGKLRLRKTLIDLASVVRDAIASMQSTIDEHGHQLHVTFPDEEIVVHADAPRITQVVCNLLSNAAKYTPQGGQIWLRVRREGENAVIVVKDTGIGIPADMLGRVFDSYFQIDNDPDHTYVGLGLGLALVKSLVELHDGTVRACSGGAKQGSEFSIALPLVTQTLLHAAAKPAGEKHDLRANNCRILVVDDNQDAAEMLNLLLRPSGCESQVAFSGKEALEIASKFHPDIVFLDIGMPQLDGYEVARRIRQEPWGAEITLVALTGWGQDEDRQRTQEAGFNYHLVKPADFSALKTILAEYRQKG